MARASTSPSKDASFFPGFVQTQAFLTTRQLHFHSEHVTQALTGHEQNTPSKLRLHFGGALSLLSERRHSIPDTGSSIMIGISKKEKLGHETNHPDRLSNLPLDITHKILALIPIREAVKTCMLSSHWRYKWVTLPQLVFKENRPLHISMDKFKECAENFITNLLLRHKGPIYKFQVSVRFSPCSQTIDQWMHCLPRNDIRELIMDMEYDESCYSVVHSIIYSFKKLTYLELSDCEIHKPPSTFKGFMFLRGLNFENVFLSPMSDGDAFEIVFAKSPHLEKLCLTNCWDSPGIWINAPSLKYLFLRGQYMAPNVHAPLLAEMFIGLSENDFRKDYTQEQDSECNYTFLLGSKTKLEKLIIDFYTMKYLSCDIVSSYQPLVFPLLKVIKLFGVDSRIIRDVLVVAHLIVGAPNLEMLKIDSRDFTDDPFPNPDAKKVSFMDIRSALKSRFEKLRVVEMRGVKGHVLEMELIKNLVEKSPVLEVVCFEICYGLGAEDRRVLRDVLQSSICASPIAKITFFPPPPGFATM